MDAEVVYIESGTQEAIERVTTALRAVAYDTRMREERWGLWHKCKEALESVLALTSDKRYAYLVEIGNVSNSSIGTIVVGALTELQAVNAVAGRECYRLLNAPVAYYITSEPSPYGYYVKRLELGDMWVFELSDDFPNRKELPDHITLRTE